MDNILNKNINHKLVLIILTLFLALVLAGAVSAEELPLTTNNSGTVSGDLYVDAQQPTPFGSQPKDTGVTQEVTFNFGSSGYTDIQYARLYTMVYVAGTDNRECNVEVSMDGNNDGNYETALDSVTLNTASSGDGNVHWQNDHINRVYSDYLLFYDVKNYIQNGIVNVKVQTSPGAANMDGRIKYIALVVAYNDGDNDVIAYWVNDGHQWFNDQTFRETTFNTTLLVPGWDSAQLKALTTSSADAAYTFNGNIKPGGVPSNFLHVNTWDVTSDLNPGQNSTLRYAKASGSYKTTLSTLKVRYEAKPDLKITVVNYNPDNAAGHRELFAHEANNIVATIVNSGNAAAGAFNVNLNINGYTETRRVDGLGIGETVNLVFTGYTPSSVGMKNVEVNVDSGDEIVESSETNNTFTGQREVFYNGYKGKSYTDGDDLETTNYLEGFINLIYSHGNSAYRGSGASNWNNPYNVTWTSTDLPIPEGATIILAKLYQGYTWNTVPGMPDFNAEFNGTPINVLAHYFDQKSYGTSNYPGGLMVYNVTHLFNTNGNTLKLTKGANTLTALYGSYLVVVYEQAGQTFKRIWINEEADMLYSRTDYSTNDEEATAYANYTNLPTTGLVDAKFIAILASANEVGKSKFYFNGSEYTGFWSDYLTIPQIGFSVFNVTGDVQAGNNVAAMQSHNPGSNGDNMVALNAIFIVEYQPTASFTGTPTSGISPLEVQFFSTSTGATEYLWDFGDGATSTDQNPTHTYQQIGIYTVKLTVTGPGGSNTKTEDNYITVNHPAPVASFTGTPTTGISPLQVAFTSTSTGTIDSYEWNFGDGSTSTATNPTHTYTVPGIYTVTLKVTGPGGEDTKTETNYITVNHPAPVASFTATPLSGRAPLKVQFTNHSTGTITSYEWDFGDGVKSTAANPSHTYTKTGVYTVKLTVRGPGGTNTQTRTQYITVKLPDLVMQSVTAPTTARRGGTIRVTSRVRNSGTISTGKGFYVAFYLRSTKTSWRYYIGRRWVGNLGVGFSSSKTNYFQIPRNIPSGRYYVEAVADYTKLVKESSRANNVKYTTDRTNIR
ncbi:MAG: hypothetical protein Kow0019_15860 [Methanobacteriaceae archaeon]